MTKRKPNAEALLDAACSKYELMLAWEPGRTQPVGVNFITVNDQLLIHDRIQPDSPVVFQRLPAPDGDGKFTVVFSITFEVPLRGAVVAITNRETGRRTVLDSKGAVERGTVWRNEVSCDAQ
jgi:hypothetical protein